MGDQASPHSRVTMVMTADYGLFGEDGASQARKNLKTLGCVLSALAAGALLGAAISSNTSTPAVSDMAALGLMKNRLGAPRANILRDSEFSSRVAQLAMTSLEVNNRINQGERDISMNSIANFDSMDETNKERLEAAVSKMKYKNNWMAGISPPMGYFDPLGFSTQLSTGKLLFYREVELKHGRVAMLAALGMVVGEQFHPLFGGNIDVPSIFAFQETPLETFWPAVVAAIAIPEIYSVFTFEEPGGKLGTGESWAMKTDVDREPGDLGFDPLGLKPTNPEEFKEMQNKELNNGRLAMIAAAGMIAQELATGQKLF